MEGNLVPEGPDIHQYLGDDRMEPKTLIAYNGLLVSEMNVEEARNLAAEMGRLWREVQDELRSCEGAFRDTDVSAYMAWRQRDKPHWKAWSEWSVKDASPFMVPM